MYEIHINLSLRQLVLKDGDKIVLGPYPVGIGKPATPTPVGKFTILDKMVNPGGPLGTRWMGFTLARHGIHGNNDPGSIGKAVSLGCVRMHNRDVETLYPLVEIGTPVIITRGEGDHLAQPQHDPNPHKIINYEVKPGDSLWLIAQRFNTTVDAITVVNNIENIDLIYPGDIIRVPVDVSN